MFKRAPFVSIWNLNDKFKVGKGKQFMHTLVYCILIAVGGIRWAIFDAQIREHREWRVCAVLSKALKGLPCFPTCELAGRTPRVCGSCQKSGAQGQAEGWGRRGALARALFPGASPLPKRSRHGPAALLTRWAVLRTGPQSLESPSLLRPVASLADLHHGQEQRRVTPDRTHTCPLLPREAPSLSPKAAVCTNNPWKGSPEQKQSMLQCLQDREKLDTRREQLPDIHSSKRLQSSKRDLWPYPSQVKLLQCVRIFCLPCHPQRPLISVPLICSKNPNRVALENIFNKFIKKRLINLGEIKGETMNMYCTVHSNGENTFKHRNSGYQWEIWTMNCL